MSASPRHRRQVDRPRVADRHRRIALEEQQRHRLADDLAPPDHDRVLASDGDTLAIEKLHHTGRRARRQRRPSLQQTARIERVETVHVLGRINRVEDVLLRVLPHRRRERRLHEDAVDPVVDVQLVDQRQQLAQLRRRRQAMNDHVQARLLTGPFLAADVDVRRGVVADEDDRQSRWPAGGRRERVDRRRELRANRRGSPSAIKSSGGHEQ